MKLRRYLSAWPDKRPHGKKRGFGSALIVALLLGMLSGTAQAACDASGLFGLGGGAALNNGTDDGIIETVLRLIENTLAQVLAIMYCGFQSNLQGPLSAAFVTAVLIFGVAVFTSYIRLTFREAFIILAKLALVYSFAMSSDYGIKIAAKLSMSLLQEATKFAISGMNGNTSVTQPDVALTGIMNMISSDPKATGGPAVTNMCGGVSCINDDILKIMITCASTLAVLGVALAVFMPVILIFIGMMLFKFFMLYIKSFLSYIISVVLLTFLFILSPIFISFWLFKLTTPLFERWVQYLWAFSLQTAILFAFIAMIQLIKAAFELFIYGLVRLLRPYDIALSAALATFPIPNACSICEYRVDVDAAGVKVVNCQMAVKEADVNPAMVGSTQWLVAMPELFPATILDGGTSASAPPNMVDGNPMNYKVHLGSVLSSKNNDIPKDATQNGGRNYVVPLQNLIQQADFLGFLMSNIFALWVIAAVFQEFINKAPDFAQRLGGLRIPGGIGGKEAYEGGMGFWGSPTASHANVGSARANPVVNPPMPSVGFAGVRGVIGDAGSPFMKVALPAAGAAAALGAVDVFGNPVKKPEGTGAVDVFGNPVADNSSQEEREAKRRVEEANKELQTAREQSDLDKKNLEEAYAQQQQAQKNAAEGKGDITELTAASLAYAEAMERAQKSNARALDQKRKLDGRKKDLETLHEKASRLKKEGLGMLGPEYAKGSVLDTNAGGPDRSVMNERERRSKELLEGKAVVIPTRDLLPDSGSLTNPRTGATRDTMTLIGAHEEAAEKLKKDKNDLEFYQSFMTSADYEKYKDALEQADKGLGNAASADDVAKTMSGLAEMETAMNKLSKKNVLKTAFEVGVAALAVEVAKYFNLAPSAYAAEYERKLNELKKSADGNDSDKALYGMISSLNDLPQQMSTAMANALQGQAAMASTIVPESELADMYARVNGLDAELEQAKKDGNYRAILEKMEKTPELLTGSVIARLEAQVAEAEKIAGGENLNEVKDKLKTARLDLAHVKDLDELAGIRQQIVTNIDAYNESNPNAKIDKRRGVTSEDLRKVSSWMAANGKTEGDLANRMDAIVYRSKLMKEYESKYGLNKESDWQTRDEWVKLSLAKDAQRGAIAKADLTKASGDYYNDIMLGLAGTPKKMLTTTAASLQARFDQLQNVDEEDRQYLAGSLHNARADIAAARNGEEYKAALERLGDISAQMDEAASGKPITRPEDENEATVAQGVAAAQEQSKLYFGALATADGLKTKLAKLEGSEGVLEKDRKYLEKQLSVARMSVLSAKDDDQFKAAQAKLDGISRQLEDVAAGKQLDNRPEDVTYEGPKAQYMIDIENDLERRKKREKELANAPAEKKKTEEPKPSRWGWNSSVDFSGGVGGMWERAKERATMNVAPLSNLKFKPQTSIDISRGAKGVWDDVSARATAMAAPFKHLKFETHTDLPVSAGPQGVWESIKKRATYFVAPFTHYRPQWNSSIDMSNGVGGVWQGVKLHADRFGSQFKGLAHPQFHSDIDFSRGLGGVWNDIKNRAKSLVPNIPPIHLSDVIPGIDKLPAGKYERQDEYSMNQNLPAGQAPASTPKPTPKAEVLSATASMPVGSGPAREDEYTRNQNLPGGIYGGVAPTQAAVASAATSAAGGAAMQPEQPAGAKPEHVEKKLKVQGEQEAPSVTTSVPAAEAVQADQVAAAAAAPASQEDRQQKQDKQTFADIRTGMSALSAADAKPYQAALASLEGQYAAAKTDAEREQVRKLSGSLLDSIVGRLKTSGGDSGEARMMKMSYRPGDDAEFNRADASTQPTQKKADEDQIIVPKAEFEERIREGKLVKIERDELLPKGNADSLLQERDAKGELLPIYLDINADVSKEGQNALKLQTPDGEAYILITESYHKWTARNLFKSDETFTSRTSDEDSFRRELQAAYAARPEYSEVMSRYDNLKSFISQQTKDSAGISTRYAANDSEFVNENKIALAGVGRSSSGNYYITFNQDKLIEALATDSGYSQFKGAIGHELAHISLGYITPEAEANLHNADDPDALLRQRERKADFKGLGPTGSRESYAFAKLIATDSIIQYNDDHKDSPISKDSYTAEDLKKVSDWISTRDIEHPAPMERIAYLEAMGALMIAYEQRGRVVTQQDREEESRWIEQQLMKQIDDGTLPAPASLKGLPESQKTSQQDQGEVSDTSGAAPMAVPVGMREASSADEATKDTTASTFADIRTGMSALSSTDAKPYQAALASLEGQYAAAKTDAEREQVRKLSGSLLDSIVGRLKTSGGDSGDGRMMKMSYRTGDETTQDQPASSSPGFKPYPLSSEEQKNADMLRDELGLSEKDAAMLAMRPGVPRVTADSPVPPSVAYPASGNDTPVQTTASPAPPASKSSSTTTESSGKVPKTGGVVSDIAKEIKDEIRDFSTKSGPEADKKSGDPVIRGIDTLDKGIKAIDKMLRKPAPTPKPEEGSSDASGSAGASGSTASPAPAAGGAGEGKHYRRNQRRLEAKQAELKGEPVPEFRPTPIDTEGLKAQVQAIKSAAVAGTFGTAATGSQPPAASPQQQGDAPENPLRKLEQEAVASTTPHKRETPPLPDSMVNMGKQIGERMGIKPNEKTQRRIDEIHQRTDAATGYPQGAKSSDVLAESTDPKKAAGQMAAIELGAMADRMQRVAKQSNDPLTKATIGIMGAIASGTAPGMKADPKGPPMQAPAPYVSKEPEKTYDEIALDRVRQYENILAQAPATKEGNPDVTGLSMQDQIKLSQLQKQMERDRQLLGYTPRIKSAEESFADIRTGIANIGATSPEDAKVYQAALANLEGMQASAKTIGEKGMVRQMALGLLDSVEKRQRADLTGKAATTVTNNKKDQ